MRRSVKRRQHPDRQWVVEVYSNTWAFNPHQDLPRGEPGHWEWKWERMGDDWDQKPMRPAGLTACVYLLRKRLTPVSFGQFVNRHRTRYITGEQSFRIINLKTGEIIPAEAIIA